MSNTTPFSPEDNELREMNAMAKKLIENFDKWLAKRYGRPFVMSPQSLAEVTEMLRAYHLFVSKTLDLRETIDTVIQALESPDFSPEALEKLKLNLREEGTDA